MFTSAQLRSARATLKWSLEELSQRSGVGTTTLKRFESADGVPNGNLSTFNTLRKIFEEAGIEFIGTPEDGPGVRYYPKK
ncbi:helix-turn-helix transcriptional regulator [Polynucleobacter sp. MWH-Spelu-300-X4]|uniref:helix-turn-helix domain-containing protein n=1 Tax=Polynucleobacter sp. MWH-Spelu-300-X4 TaxID=2689109 RepID=UPI001BFE07E2|nr:helix-turn-helix transcriptional regulator [Polynucleobacter sp. MWH-Spelu-300-X4]